MSSTKRTNRGRKELGLLWQGRSFDRAPRTVKESREKAEYIHQNPVKAGVAPRPEDWCWSSGHDDTGAANRPPTTPSGQSIDRALLPADERTRL